MGAGLPFLLCPTNNVQKHAVYDVAQQPIPRIWLFSQPIAFSSRDDNLETGILPRGGVEAIIAMSRAVNETWR